MSCNHENSSTHRATLVDQDGKRVLRTYCPDCRAVVEGEPVVDRKGNVHVSKWTSVDYVAIPGVDPESREFEPNV